MRFFIILVLPPHIYSPSTGCARLIFYFHIYIHFGWLVVLDLRLWIFVPSQFFNFLGSRLEIWTLHRRLLHAILQVVSMNGSPWR
jgi:hypothetical protein